MVFTIVKLLQWIDLVVCLKSSAIVCDAMYFGVRVTYL